MYVMRKVRPYRSLLVRINMWSMHQGPVAGKAEGRNIPYQTTLISNFILNLIPICVLK